MSLKRIALCSLLVALGFAGTASAQTPTWCGAKGNSRWPSWENALEEDPTRAIPSIVACVCEHNCGSNSADWATHGQEVEQARQKWSKRLAMTDDDWADAADWAASGAPTSYDMTSRYRGKAWSALGPVDQYSLIQNSQMGDSAAAVDANYVADAFGTHLTEAGRLGYILWCTSGNVEVQWAMCQPDLDAFDPTKIPGELRADKTATGAQRFAVRLAVDTVRARLIKHAANVKAAAEKDPAYAQMFKIAAGTRQEWAGMWRNEATLVDLVLAMDDARVTGSRRLVAGCEEKTWAAFKEAVSSIPAKQFATIDPDALQIQPRLAAARLVVATPKGYLASVAQVLCHRGDEHKDPVIRALGTALSRWPGFRGPRTATQIAIGSAGLQLDDSRASIQYPGVDRGWMGYDGGSNGGGFGVVKAVKPQGDLVHVEFAPQAVKEPRCVKYSYTNRVTGIDTNGHFIRESGCAKEEMVTTESTASPVNLKKQYAAVIKPGMKLMATEDAVDLAWAKPGNSTPSVVLGVPLK